MKRLILIIMIIMLTAEGCFEDERIGLFQLKSSYHSSGRSTFSSWGFYNDNCCEWEGVECSSSTGRLIHLFVQGDYHIGNPEWKFNASLFFPFQQLTSLTLHYFLIGSCVQNQGFDRLSTLENFDSLDLSGNEFKDINIILSSIGRISSLKSLSLSYTGLNSTTDIQDLVRLENLEVLDLSRNSFNNSIFSIVSRFSSLKSLSLEESALTGSKGFDMLSRLENLESLDLSDNYYNMDKSILSSISNISSLKSLYLRSNNGLNSTTDIQGPLSKLVNLELLDLSENNFNNSILLSLASLSSLKTLDLSYNRLEGTIDLQGLSKLVNLEVLDLSYNGLEGTIDLQGLTDAYDSVGTQIRHLEPLPEFYKARSMLILEESARNRKTAVNCDNTALTVNDGTAAAPYPSPAASHQQHQYRPSGGHRGGRNGGRFNRGRNHRGRGRGRFLQFTSSPWPSHTWASNQPCAVAPCPYPTYQPSPYSPSQQPGLPTSKPIFAPHQHTRPPSNSFPTTQQGILGPHPQQAHMAHDYSPTNIAEAMHTLSIQPPQDPWHMDTGATAHMTADGGIANGEAYHEM